MFPIYIKKEVIVIKRQSKVLYESANILCWFRIAVSLGLALTVKQHMACAILFSMAFISDALDGWCYRKFTQNQPYQHWFNHLPITMDPLADFCLVIGGIIHNMDNKPMGLLVALIVTVIDLAWQWLGKRSTDRVFAISMTTLTYVWYALMVLTVAGVWRCNFEPHWFVGFVVTMVIFYTIWLNTRVKSRTIRRRG